ncbi:glycosyltransferase family 4 protein [Sphingobacterium kyonggiense]|uniref:Glycosyltransferase family 4 protein n=1 Tax=Sphingobacterium kyonggiense TaxID=714075 RepID=A0ABP7Z464_9SPHI
MENYLLYTTILAILFVLEIIYFRIADRYNIIDKPNERSSHNRITLRGGGIIFYLGIVIYFIVSKYQYPWFFIGISLMAIISFLDDVFTLSNRLRLFVHFSSVLLMALQLDIFSMPWYFLIVAFIIVVGVINAYNFMDGINGITGLYSLIVLLLLFIINKELQFIDEKLLIITVLSVLVFSFYNFRNTAKCFAGDVGSVVIAYIIIFAIGALIIKAQNLIFILFLAVYGIDTIWTIIHRLKNGENIFEAHRSHLYQYLANEVGINKLVVSIIYSTIQLIIGLLLIYISKLSVNIQLISSILILLFLSIIYLWIKNILYRKFLLKKI